MTTLKNLIDEYAPEWSNHFTNHRLEMSRHFVENDTATLMIPKYSTNTGKKLKDVRATIKFHPTGYADRYRVVVITRENEQYFSDSYVSTYELPRIFDEVTCERRALKWSKR